jgi:hypothetical protein
MISILAGGFFSDGRGTGCAAGPAAWAASVSSGLEAPAGLVRLEGWECFSGVQVDGSGNRSRFLAGYGTDLGVLSVAFGLGYGSGDGAPDTLVAAASLAKVLTGNPIAFMEGLFGPNISVGGSLELVNTTGEDSRTSLMGGAGVQFSVFPSFAVGVDAGSFLIAGDSLRESSWEYGISHVFNRDIRGHLTFMEKRVSVGADLRVTQGVRVSTGTDGSSWSLGAGLDVGRFTFDYGLDITESSTVHVITLSFCSGEQWNR